MRVKRYILLLLLVVAFVSNARVPIGTLTLYRANKEIVIHGVKFKKGEIVADDFSVQKVSKMGFSVMLNFYKKGNYYIIEHWNPNYEVPNKKIPVSCVNVEKYKKHQLLISDVGNFATFANKSGKKVRIFKCNTNGHHFIGNDEIINVKNRTIYLLCTDSFFVLLETKNNHFKLYDSDKKGFVGTNAYIKSFDYNFDNHGNMLRNQEITEGYFMNDLFSSRPELHSIAYLHDTQELYLDGEFFKRVNEQNQR